MIFLTIYMFYGYSLFSGGLLKWNSVVENDTKFTGGTIVTIMFCVMLGAFGIGNTQSVLKIIQEAQIGAKLAYDVIDNVPDVNPDEEGEKVQRQDLRGRIEFRNISFNYPSRKELRVLNNFSAVFEAGKTTAIVGASGSGKSSIIQLIERFYDPAAGEILLDGKNIIELDLRSMRQCIGYVGQEPILFNTTIKENMLFSKPDATDDEIEQALKSANAWDFIIERLGKEGINAQVGEYGNHLSGGQKQRIAIARAFLKKPKILLFDEATSALDKVNERAVQEAIDNYRRSTGQITIIVIAHRMSTIKDSDRIVVLQNGHLVEQGRHFELLTKYPRGIYSGFWKKQKRADELTVKGKVIPGADETFVQRVFTKKKRQGRQTVEQQFVHMVSMDDFEKFNKVDQVDQEDETLEMKLKERLEKEWTFTKLLPFNRPSIFLIVAFFGSIFSGAAMPVFGALYGKLLSVLSMPHTFITTAEGIEYLKEEVRLNSLNCVLISVVAFLARFFSKYSYDQLSINVTEQVRSLLYKSIVEKHIGWFDNRDHSSGFLSQTLSESAAIINGTSTESLSPMIEATCSLAIGILISLYFSW
mmetsp:Transcript_6128/g.9828  ORF Transcript_6128/g.9828 Transcript_6128/m.9828 type:complete len:587 (-) Transcript_6128:1564-3324(-)